MRPTFLKQPAIAQLVLASLEYGADAVLYQLHAWVVRPNQRTGQPFWQDESDHLIRSDHEFRRIRGYIENNPVAACRPTGGICVVQRRAA